MHLVVHGLQHLKNLLIEQPGNIYHWPLRILLVTWKHFFEALQFFFFEISAIPLGNFDKLVKQNLTLIVLVRQFLEPSHENFPFSYANLLSHFPYVLDCLGCVHLLMEVAEIQVILCRLEALLMIANRDVALLRFVLSEVKAFLREHLRADRVLEILVGNEPVAINVELIEAMRDAGLRNVHSPEVQKELELLHANLAGLLDVQVHEGLAHRFPLRFNFV